MKIGLIAMSGIRVCDAELLDLGLTLPGFVERSKVIASLPSLGLLTLAGMTPPDCELHYIEVADLEADGNIDGDFDLCAISTFSAQANEAYRLGKRLVEGGAQVVIGGLHVTTMPDEPASYGISAAVGEGESIWPQIVEDARHGKLEQLYDARRTSFDLADAPMPAFELLDMDRYNRLTVQTSRGCPHRCTFCASSILLTRSYKQKPAHKVLAEIDKIRALGHRSFIELADDNSFVNHSYWKALLPELEKRHIKWFTETDISISDDEELLRAMRKAGCSQVLIGLESPSSSGLDGVEARCNWKLGRAHDHKDAVRRIQANGIRVTACFVVGLDGHTTNIFDEIHDFVADVAPFDVQITYPTPFPGTTLYDRLADEGRLTHDLQWDRCTLFDINFEPLNMSGAQLREGFHRLTRELYNADFTKRRQSSFKKQWREGRAA